MVACQPETLTDAQLKASKALSRCYGALGRDGSTLAHDMLIRVNDAAADRRLRGECRDGNGRDIWVGGLHEVLNCLAVTYGFASEETKYGRNS